MPIKISYFPGGKVKIEPHDYPGEKCFHAARPYEEARNGEHTVAPGEGTAKVAVTQAQQQSLGK